MSCAAIEEYSKLPLSNWFEGIPDPLKALLPNLTRVES